jgi:hypothetical protein
VPMHGESSSTVLTVKKLLRLLGLYSAEGKTKEEHNQARKTTVDSESTGLNEYRCGGL